MRVFASVIITLLSLTLPKTVLGTNLHSHKSAPRHVIPQSAHTSDLGQNVSSVSTLEKRFDNARFSYFDTGLGACGKVNKASDFVVALNHAQFDSGDFCSKMITITCRGKTANAQIVDRCVECPFGALDFTRGLFDFFGSQALGYIYGSWNLVGVEPPKPTPKPTPKPSPTRETPTTTSSKPEEPKTTSTRKTSTTIATTSSLTVASSTTSTSSSTPSSTLAAIPTDAISHLSLFMVGFAEVLIGAAGQIAK